MANPKPVPTCRIPRRAHAIAFGDGRFAVSVSAGVIAGLLTLVGAASVGADVRLATPLAAGVNVIPAASSARHRQAPRR